jgi:glycosyltransferase involved in cell wall biosynthesis
MTSKEIHFFNDVRLTGRKTNVLTRREMIKGFAELDELDKVVVHYVASNQSEKAKTMRELETDKIKPRPVYLPGFANSIQETFSIQFIYKVLVLNRLLKFIYLWRFITEARYSISYVWGVKLSISAIFSKYIVSNSFILEVDDYIFGEDRLNDFIFLKAASSALKISTVSEQTKKDLIKRDVNSENVEVLPNAVNYNEFSLDRSKKEIRKQLGISSEKFVVTYTGHLYDWKGVENLLDAVKYLESSNLEILLIGGKKRDIEKYREKVRNRGLEDCVNVIGYVSRRKIPKYQNCSDVLVIPNMSKDLKSEKYTSPVKLREYMASGTPIIASSLPSIQEIVSEEEIFYFEADEPKSLAEKINFVRENSEKSSEKTEKSLQKVKGYDWRDRAEKILENVF